MLNMLSLLIACCFLTEPADMTPNLQTLRPSDFQSDFPVLAIAKGDVLVVVWSQVNDRNLMELKSQQAREGKIEADEITLASSDNGGNVLARTATDRVGRVWVVWQAMRGQLSDVFCRT